MFLIFPPIPGLTSQPQLKFGVDLSPQLAQTYPKIITFFKDRDYSGLIIDIKIFAAIAVVVLIIIIVNIMIKMNRMFEERVEELEHELNPPAPAATAGQARWQEIKTHVNSFKESDWKLAVIEADKFVDEALKTAGFAGETMGERLMLMQPGQILNLQNLWDAHKLRNLIVHDTNYQPAHRQAILATEAYESVLHELGALT